MPRVNNLHAYEYIAGWHKMYRNEMFKANFAIYEYM